jgi:hypothetical protein
MTTTTFTHFETSDATWFVSLRAPRKSFAARLAVLQARHDRRLDAHPVFGAVGPAILALVPFVALVWMFATL